MDYSTRSTSARVREWQYLTGRDFAEMDRARTVALVSCSPLEVHGPHLPVITDNWEAEGLALRAIEKLSARFDDLEFVHLPPIYVAADVVPQPGSVMFRPTTILRVLEDLGRSLAKQGFRHIWVSSFHGGPRHFVPIELAAHRTNERYGTKMVSVFSLMIARLTNGGSDLKNVLGQLDHKALLRRAHLQRPLRLRALRPVGLPRSPGAPASASPTASALRRGARRSSRAPRRASAPRAPAALC